MSFVPPQYSKFGKTAIFQTYDKDSLDHVVKLTTKSVNGVKFEAATVFAPKANPRGYLKTNFGLKGVVVDTTLETDAGKASSVAFNASKLLGEKVKGLGFNGTLSTSEKDLAGKPKYGVFATDSFEYSRPNFTATVTSVTDADSQHSVAASASVGFEGFSVGGDVKLIKTADTQFTPKSYNVGATYTRGNYTGTLVSDAKFEKLKFTLVGVKLCKRGNVTAGVQAKVDLQAPKVGAPQREFTFAVENQLSEDTKYRFAAVTDGTLVYSVEHKLASPQVVISATGVAALPTAPFVPFAVSKFGVSAAFGEQ